MTSTMRNLSKRIPIRGRGYSLASHACGPLDCRMCALVCESTGDAALVDPSFTSPFEFRALIDHLDRHEATPKNILLTHAHPDHVAGVPATLEAWPNASLHLHSLEGENYARATTLGREFGIRIDEALPPPTHTLVDGAVLRVGESIELGVVHTPGHAPGHVAFVDTRSGSDFGRGDAADDDGGSAAGSVLISGDLLFAGSVGRTDFPNASEEDLSASLRRLYERFDDDSIVLSGHTTPTFLKRERAANPFVDVALRRPLEWYREASQRHAWKDGLL